VERKFEILVVDDDMDLASNLQDILEAEGYHTAVAHDSQTALTLSRKKVFDLALIDIKLPDISGVELIRRLTKLLPGMECIIATGYASLETAVEVVGQRHVVAYEIKPLNMDHLLALIRQVVGRKQAEEALHQERNKAQKYLDVAGVMLVAIDANQKVSLINKKGCEILGCKEEEIIGQNWFDKFLPERVRDEVIAAFEKLMAGEIEPVEYFENPVLTRTGGETFIAWHNAVLTDAAGNIVGVLCSGEDITERQLLWKKMVEYRELNKLKTNLLSNVSHELRTPLTSIKGFATTLLREETKWSKAEQRDFLRAIDQGTERLTRLINDLLDMSRLEAGVLELERDDYHISEILDSVSDELANLTRNHKLEVIVPAELPIVFVDEVRIGQVLVNLVENATKHSWTGSQITITAQPDGNQVVISVTDRGEGIPTELLDRVFDRFYQAESIVSGRKTGTGLGLSICWGIIQAHGGRIWVESRLGEGSNFSFTLQVSTRGGEIA